ncbi:MAG TPA: cation:proton antiporter, partial [Gemmatimonadota bacterium]|nr:cation:proton antiporter [Gemmatimonadota bacterium]
AVALILFEGGLQLHYVDLASVGRAVRNLVTVGAALTVTGAALAAHYVVGFAWPLAVLFGAIVSVTGPTVINPLLDRVRVQRRIDTVLRGEGIVIDPIGAIFAVVVLELIVTSDSSLWSGFGDFLIRMGLGAAIGLAGGWLLGRVLRTSGLVGDELKNLVVLAGVLALFAVSEWIAGESGLAAVVIAGMTLRRESIPEQHLLRRFKSELSILFISMLFILLSAHLRLSTIAAVGWGGVAVVLILMWVVRPVNVLVSTWRTGLDWRERLFLMWICPRGVVAISISSFVAILIQAGSPGLSRSGLGPGDGDALMALVFLTIAITVVLQGISAAAVADLLGVSAGSTRYAVIVGADPLGCTLAEELRARQWELLLIDANPTSVARARGAGLAAIVGNALDRAVLDEARIEDASVLVAVTANQEVNFLACQLARDEYQAPHAYPALVDRERGPREELLRGIGGEIAFARETDVERWNHDLAGEAASVVSAEAGAAFAGRTVGEAELEPDVLPLLVVRNDESQVCHLGLRISIGDRIVALVREGAEERFRARVGAKEPDFSEART